MFQNVFFTFKCGMQKLLFFYGIYIENVICGSAYNMDVELSGQITYNMYVCNSLKKLPYAILYIK